MTVLRDLLNVSLDGEWGKDEPDADSVEMSVIRGTDFEDVRVGSISKVPTRFLASRHAARKRLQPWDIVFETAGGSPGRPTGRSLLITASRFARFQNPVTCASFARFLRISPERADPAFVYWMLQHLYDSRELLRFNTQHTGVARFQFTTFADNHELRLPSLSVQRHVASILSVYDDLIEVNTRRIAVLEEMARRLFEEWFVHFRFPGHETKPTIETPNGPCPQGWSLSALGDLAEIQWGDTSKTKSSYVESGFAAYSATGKDGALPYYDFDRTGVVLSAIGANCGRTWFASGKWSCIKNTIRLWSKDTAISDEFLFYATQKIDYWPRRGAAQPFISQGDARRCLIVQPDHQTGKKFQLVAGPALRLQCLLERQNINLGNARNLLLPKLISGEIDLERTERGIERAANRVAAE